MTESIKIAARSCANVDSEIIAQNPIMGPVSIEGYYDEAFAIPGMLADIAMIQRSVSPVDAIIIACFDDTGLEAARTITDAPVIGIGEAAFHVASLLAHRFSVVTTLSRSIAAIENNLLKYGLASRCAKVRACEVAVLELENPLSHARKKITDEIARAKLQDGADAIVLGCAGMAALAASLSLDFGLPVIDGVASAVKLAEGLVALKLKTSKLGAYQPPQPKTYTGIFAPYAPLG